MEYNTNGSWVAIAGFVVTALAHFGIFTDTNGVLSIIGGIVTIVGLVKQHTAHKKLAVASGAIKNEI